MPEKFNVEIYKNLNKENVVNKSKTTGEPPLMLAMSVFFCNQGCNCFGRKL